MLQETEGTVASCQRKRVYLTDNHCSDSYERCETPGRQRGASFSTGNAISISSSEMWYDSSSSVSHRLPAIAWRTRSLSWFTIRCCRSVAGSCRGRWCRCYRTGRKSSSCLTRTAAYKPRESTCGVASIAWPKRASCWVISVWTYSTLPRRSCRPRQMCQTFNFFRVCQTVTT